MLSFIVYWNIVAISGNAPKNWAIVSLIVYGLVVTIVVIPSTSYFNTTIPIVIAIDNCSIFAEYLIFILSSSI